MFGENRHGPSRNPHYTAEEIELRAADARIVQVQLLAMNETLPGRRYYWPIYEFRCEHHLPIGIPAGSAFRHAPTSNGWPSHYVQDYVGLSMGFDFAAAQACMANRRGSPVHLPTVRQHVRMTIQAFDAPTAAELNTSWSISTATICCCSPPTFRIGISTDVIQNLAVDNPLATYPRLSASTPGIRACLAT